MSFVNAPEKIMKVAHDVLVGSRHEYSNVVRILIIQRMEGQGFAHIPDVRKATDLAIGIAGDVAERALHGGAFVEPMDGHDRENLTEGPVVQQALKDGEVAQIL